MTPPPNPNPQDQRNSKYESPTMVMTMVVNGAIAGTYQLNLRDQTNAAVLTVAGLVIDAGSATTPGKVAFTLTSTQTGPLLGVYKYDIWRTDPGNEKRLTWGQWDWVSEQWK